MANTRQKERAKRIIDLKQFLVEKSVKGEKVEYKQMIGWLVINKYVAYRTAKEDIDSLIAAGFVKKVGNEIYVPEDEAFQQTINVKE